MSEKLPTSYRPQCRIDDPVRRVYTTGQIARFAAVAPRTVGKWFDSGKLEGYRIPGSQDRRVPAAAVLKFFRDHKMVEAERALMGDAGTIVLVVGMPEMAAALPGRLGDACRVEAAADPFAAGLALGSMRCRRVSCVASWWGGCHLGDLAAALRQAGPVRRMICVGAGDMTAEVQAAGWIALPADVTVDAVAVALDGREARAS